MAVRKTALRARGAYVVVAIIVSCASTLVAQRFVDPGFRSYPMRSAAPSAIEDSLRRFLADRIQRGEAVDVVSDNRERRLLVRGSEEIQRLASQFIEAVDRPGPQATVAQAPRSVRGYEVANVAELLARTEQLRQQFANRNDVRIAADERTRQIVVHAPEEVHQLIRSTWTNGRPAAAQPPVPVDPVGVTQPPVTRQQVQLRHITWQDLLRGLRNVQGQNAAVSSPQNGTLEMTLTSDAGSPTQLRINQQNQVVQISGSSADAKNWTKVVQALDQQPTNPGEQNVMGRLGDAQPTTITRTITMLGALGADQPFRPLSQQDAEWGGDVVQRMFNQQREPIVIAQADGVPQPGASPDGVAVDGGGNFLGPVRIEFLEGTDIFIVRGQKRDVDRVMQIIRDIEAATQETAPKIEVYPLQHANSEAMAALLNQLNEEPLQARQGDISISPLVKPNALLLIGREAGVESVKNLIEQLDVPTQDSAPFRVFRLTYLAAVDAERMLNFLYNPAQQQTQEPVGLEPRVQIIADYRTNSIIVHGSARDVEEIGELIAQVDVKGGGTVAEIQVFPLKNAIAEEVANVLDLTLQTNQAQTATQGAFGQGQAGGTAGGNPNTQPRSSPRAVMLQMKMFDKEQGKLIDDEIIESGILSNVIVTFNERTNSVIVNAPKGTMKLIAEIIKQIDELPSQEAMVRVYTVTNGDASTLVEMLDTLFPQDQQDGPLVQSAAGTSESTLVPLRFAFDPRTNSIIFTGNAADLEVVEAILFRLDASNMSGRKTFVYELANQQASIIADAVTEYMLQRRTAVTTLAPDTLSPYQLIDQEIVVVAEDNSNKVIISVTDRYYDEVIRLLEELDKRPDMVLVKCLIAEVDLNATEELGVELGIQDSLLFNRSTIDPVTGILTPGFNFNNMPLGTSATNPGSGRDQVAGQALSDLGLGRTNSSLGYGGLVLSASNESVSVLLRALQECRRLDILSRPQVMTLNNSIGRVSVGSDVPFVTDSVTNGLQTSNAVDFREVGLTLEVSPRISPDELIVLDIAITKSELGSVEDGIPIAVSAGGAIIRQPVIDQTTARTFVSSRDGQTVILGGLITKQRSSFERKVPYLGDVPFFGRLFRADGITESRKELLIILTPYIVKDEEADFARINAEEYARMSWCLGNVIETHGNIGPGGGIETIEETLIYSEPDPMDIDPAAGSLPDRIEPTPSPLNDGSWIPTPEFSVPPQPNLDPNASPQVNRSSGAPGSGDRESSGSLFGPLIGRRPSSSGVRPAEHAFTGDDDSATHAIYRFDQIPINE